MKIQESIPLFPNDVTGLGTENFPQEQYNSS